ncbi:MAG: hypothetical protein GY851_18455 [bacterium]|nr:hypothetical protein [bacterium]
MRSFWRSVRFLVLLALSCVASMLVSFHVIRYYAATPVESTPPDSARIAEANVLRTGSNGLLRLTASYMERLGAETGDPSDDFLEWVDKTFRPQLNEYRRGLLAATSGGDELAALVRAADRAAAMASRPGEMQLRKRAVADVLRVAQLAEERIVALGMDRYLDEPRESSDFAAAP